MNKTSTQKEKPVAIFDIDGTIFRSSLLIELVEVFIEREIFDKTVRAEYEASKIKWLDRKGDYEAYIMDMVKVFVMNIKGVHYDDFVKAAEVVVARYHSRVYMHTRDLIKELHKKGYFLLAVSRSPKGIVDMFCKELGFDKAYGTFYELGPSDRFTGNIVDEDLISNKAAILKRAVTKENLTLKGSVGVGDTEGDIPFLEMVEYPICFNPNKKLYQYAKRCGWEVVVERKDVVYKL